MDDGQVLRRGIVRMGISRRRLTMRRPTGMGNTNGTADILIATKFHKIVNFPLGLIDVQIIVVVDKCHTGTVVTTILQSSKTLDQDGKGIFCAYISYDSAHIVIWFVSISVAKVRISEKKTKRKTNFLLVFPDFTIHHRLL